MAFAFHGRGAVAALGFIVCFSLFVTPAARAGEMAFTLQDAARQTAFIKEMDGAAAAAKRGDRAGAQAGLRRALAATGGGVSVLSSASRCGRPAFEVPAWLLTAQAEIGDMAGAKETARRLTSANATLEGLYIIALTQTQRPQGKKPTSKEKYIFAEAVPKKDPPSPFDAFDYRNHDYSVLQRLRLPPDPKRAATILREGVPYAAAFSRGEAAYWTRERNQFGFLPSDSAFRTLVQRQYEIGDAEGAQMTIASLPTPARRAILLLLISHDQRRSNDSRAAATEKQALALAPEIARSGPRDQAAYFDTLGMTHLWRGDAAASRDAYARCAECVRQFPTPRERYDGLHHIVMMVGTPPEPPSNVSVSPDYAANAAPDADARKMMRTLLNEMRDLIQQMPEPVFKAPAVPNGQNARFAPLYNQFDPPRALKMYDVAFSLATDAKDRAGARETLEMARKLAEQDPDPKKRERCLMMIERGGEMMERRIQAVAE